MPQKVTNSKVKALFVAFLPVLLLAVVCTWFYSPIIFMQRRIDWDAYALSYPTLLFLSDSFHSGIFPFLNPFTMSGDAFLGQCAAFAYHPLLVLAALLPLNWNLYYVFELLLLLTSFIGGVGAYFYLELLVNNKFAAFTGAAVFMTAAFIPLIGQPAVACAIASFPWLLICLEWLLSTPGKFAPVKIVVCSLVLGFSFISSYFGTFLYNLIFLALYALFRIVELTRSGNPVPIYKICFSLGAVGVAAILLTAPYLLPGLENRSFLYKELSGDFISPDLRLRGMALPIKDVGNIVRGVEDVFHILVGSTRYTGKLAKWVFGVGYSFLLLYVGAFFLKNKPKIFWFFNLVALLSSIYVIGKHGFVYMLLYNYVPVLGNIRYPSFAFYILQFSLIACGTISLAWIISKFNPKRRYVPIAALALLVVADISFYTRRSGIFEKHVYLSTTPGELYALAMPDRVKSIAVDSPLRLTSKSVAYDFKNTRWIREKALFTHGYSTYDSPYYWYFKNMDFLKSVFSVPAKVMLAPVLKRIDYKTDNGYIEAMAGVVAAADKSGTALVSRIPEGFAQGKGSCAILKTQASPNLFKAGVSAKEGCFLALNDKFYPGWRVYVNGQQTELVKSNYLFKGVYLAPGENQVEFKFVPVSFYAGLLVSAITFMGLLLTLVFVKRVPVLAANA